MAAFRKMFLAMVGVAGFAALSSNAFAVEALNCTVGAAPNQVRVEGRTELVGDILITCTGGPATANGVAIFTDNIEVTYSAPVTSRKQTGHLPSVNGSYPYLEPVVAFNDPRPVAPNPTGAPVNPSSPLQNACPNSNTGNCTNYGDGNGGTTSYGKAGNYNIYEGYTPDSLSSATGVHTIRFDGVAFDPPGSGTLTIRITNVRVDATGGVPITATVKITGAQPPAVNGSNTTQVAYPTPSIIVTASGKGYAICNFPKGYFDVLVQEGYAAAFKRRTWYADGSTSLPLPQGSAADTTYSTQNVFGYPYFTESGFYVPALNYGSDPGDPTTIGLATQGTRFKIHLTNIDKGLTVTAPDTVSLKGGIPAPAGLGGPASGSGVLKLVGVASSDGNGYFTAPSTHSFTSSAAGSTADFFYEVLYSDGGQIETADIQFGVTWTASGVTYTFPSPTYILAQAEYAPIDNAVVEYPQTPTSTPSAATSLPRFKDSLNTPPVSTFYLTGCQCDLLFPYVLSMAGQYETGIAIANTSSDPYVGIGPSITPPVTTTPGYPAPIGNSAYQTSGYVSLFLYPSQYAIAPSPAYNNGVPIVYNTTSITKTGDELLFTIGGGGYNPTNSADNLGIPGTPGFSGYMIAVTGFQFCHGFAFIVDPTVSKFAEGYLALVLDAPTGYRPFAPGENLGQ